MTKKHFILAGISMTLAISIFSGVCYQYTKKTDDKLISPLGSSFSVLSAFSERRSNYIVYGYLPYWSVNKSKYFQLDKLTDIAYFGLYIEKDGTFKKSTEEGTAEPGYHIWRNNETLKKLIANSREQGVKISLTVISHTDETSDAFLNCTPCWNTFLNELEQELNYHQISDVNLNFEYVEYADKETADKYTKFVQYVNTELDKRFEDSYVVVSTFADSLIKPRVTKIQDLAKVSDALFIMAYDFHRPTSENAGPVSPIGGAGTLSEYDITNMIRDYLANSPPSKLILGVPYYGYNWVVSSPNSYAPRIEGNDYIGYSQSQAYEDIMENILETKPNILWDKLGQVPYFSYISPKTGMIRQVYFENAKSLKIKYQLAKNKNFAGIGIWALGYDGGYTDLWELLGKEFM